MLWYPIFLGVVLALTRGLDRALERVHTFEPRAFVEVLAADPPLAILLGAYVAGFLVSLTNAEGRALHDFAAGSRVIEAAKEPARAATVAAWSA